MELLYWIIGGIALLALGFYGWKKGRALPPGPPPEQKLPVTPPLHPAADVTPDMAPAPVADEPPNLKTKLEKTRTGLWGTVQALLNKGPALEDGEWDTLEEALLEGDVGMRTTTALLTRVRERVRQGEGGGELKALLKEESQSLFADLDHGWGQVDRPNPLVISVVGVNGAGKTTTIGKLAQKFTEEGKAVLLGAGDTFRAAAISQLKVWADRTGAQFVTGREGADPGAVAFDAVTAGKARGAEVVILDTAGRLHTKANLMEELKKIHRVVKKVIPEAPHEIWLVLDGTMGQNSVQQAREFLGALDLTGVVVTKLDGTARGGAVFSIVSELGLPVKFIGVGEKASDLVPFEPGAFVDAILG